MIEKSRKSSLCNEGVQSKKKGFKFEPKLFPFVLFCRNRPADFGMKKIKIVKKKSKPGPLPDINSTFTFDSVQFSCLKN